jgi:NYN domain
VTTVLIVPDVGLRVAEDPNFAAACAVDVENLVFVGGRVTDDVVRVRTRALVEVVEEIVPMGSALIWSASSSTLKRFPIIQGTFMALGWHFYRAFEGPSGADRRLARVLEKSEWVRRMTDVYCVSGDREFAPALELLKSEGHRVTVIGPRGSIHYTLYGAANEVLALSPLEA